MFDDDRGAPARVKWPNGAARRSSLLPLALLSAAWTASLTGAGPTAAPVAASSTPEGSLPGGASVPAQAIEAPASISSPEEVSPGFEGTEAEIERIVSTSSTNGIPAAALSAYQRAESVINAADKSCKLSWQLVAAIGRVESDHGRFGGNVLNAKGVATPGIYGIALNGKKNTATIRDTDAGQYDNDSTFDRAVGPMQFIPSTWSVVGVDADGDGMRNPQDIDDAALGSAVYLCSGTGPSGDLSTLSGQKAAVFRYNNSSSYVDLVLSIADNYLEGDFTSVPNNTTAAGFLTPLPGFTPVDPRDTGPSPAPVPGAEPAPAPEAPPSPSPEPQPEPEPTKTPDDGKDDDGPRLPLPSLPPIDLPDLPDSEIEPIDQVLTLAQAIVQCTLDGLIDNPLTAVDRFDVCVEDYRTPDTKD
jgi:cell division septation protein DedD